MRSRKKRSLKTVWIAAAFLVAGLMLICPSITLSLNSSTFSLEQMGNGINIGNSLDVYETWGFIPVDDELETETLWGNPKIDANLFHAIRQMGFQTVRIPVTWSAHMDANMVISDKWLSRVREVVDFALKEGLYVILDTHHEEWLNLDLGQADETERTLRAVWKQIAERFKNHSSMLLFEGMSEPRLKASAYEWSSGTDELRQLTNRLNRAFVETVRSSGGNNRQRQLLITTYCSRIDSDVIDALEIPDSGCIVSLHYYLPNSFCLEKDSDSKWKGARDEDVKSAFKLLRDRLTSKGVPVIITEFGCIDKSNTEDRAAWTRTVVESAHAYQINCIWWDNGADFALINRYDYSWKYPEIAKQIVMMQN